MFSVASRWTLSLGTVAANSTGVYANKVKLEKILKSEFLGGNNYVGDNKLTTAIFVLILAPRASFEDLCET